MGSHINYVVILDCCSSTIISITVFTTRSTGTNSDVQRSIHWNSCCTSASIAAATAAITSIGIRMARTAAAPTLYLRNLHVGFAIRATKLRIRIITRVGARHQFSLLSPRVPRRKHQERCQAGAREDTQGTGIRTGAGARVREVVACFLSVRFGCNRLIHIVTFFLILFLLSGLAALALG